MSIHDGLTLRIESQLIPPAICWGETAHQEGFTTEAGDPSQARIPREAVRCGIRNLPERTPSRLRRNTFLPTRPTSRPNRVPPPVRGHSNEHPSSAGYGGGEHHPAARGGEAGACTPARKQSFLRALRGEGSAPPRCTCRYCGSR